MAPPSSPSAQGDDIGLGLHPLLVDRSSERQVLEEALTRTHAGKGGAWMLTGPEGIGKTTLLRWLAECAKGKGFVVAQAAAVPELLAPLLPFDLLFRRLSSANDKGVTEPLRPPSGLPSVLIFEEARPSSLFRQVATVSASSGVLLVSRERPATLKERYPSLGKSVEYLTLSRVGEGDILSPGDLDVMGERVSQYLQGGRGRTVCLAGLEYLITHNSFLPVLRLVQFLRDCAEAEDGHLLFSVAPETLEPRERSLLESEGEVFHAHSAEPDPGIATPPTQTSVRIMNYLVDLEREAPHTPLLLLLDDFQWADEASVQALRLLVRNCRSLPVLWLVAMRDRGPAALEGAQSSLQETLDDLEREGSLRRMPLSALDDAGTEALLKERFGVRLSPFGREEALAILRSETGGHPYYLEEIVRYHLQNGQFVQREGSYVLRAPPGPSGISEGSVARDLQALRRLLARRVNSLPPEDRKLLTAAALVGGVFSVPCLTAAVEEDSTWVGNRLRKLSASEAMVMPAGEPGQFTFSQPLFREVVLAQEEEGERRRLAKRLAAWWARECPNDAETIGRLLHQSGENAEAASWGRRAIEAALSQQGSQHASHLLSWFLELREAEGRSPEERATEGLELLERVFKSPRGREGAPRFLDRILMLPIGARTRQHALALSIISGSGDDPVVGRARWSTLEGDLPADRKSLPGPLQGRICAAEAQLSMREGDWDRVRESVREGLGLLSEERDDWVIAILLYDLGFAELRCGHMDQCQEVAVRGRSLVERRGLGGYLPWFDNLLGELAMSRGDASGSLAAFQRATAGSKTLGDLPGAAVDLLNEAIAHNSLQEYSEARACLAEARWIIDRFDLKTLQAEVRFREGQILSFEKRWKEAAECYAQVVATFETLGYLMSLAPAMLDWVEALIETGEVEAALEKLKHLETMEPPLPVFHRSNMETLLGRALTLSGRSEEGRKALEKGLHLARELKQAKEEAAALGALSTWEERSGNAALAATLSAQGAEILRRIGRQDGHALNSPP